jgi:hypothetical protein
VPSRKVLSRGDRLFTTLLQLCVHKSCCITPADQTFRLLLLCVQTSVGQPWLTWRDYTDRVAGPSAAYAAVICPLIGLVRAEGGGGVCVWLDAAC